MYNMDKSNLFSDSLTEDKKSYKPTITTGFGPMTDNLLTDMLNKLDTDKIKNKLTANFVDSVTDILNQKMQPYMYVAIALYSIIIMLLCVIIYLVIIKKKM